MEVAILPTSRKRGNNEGSIRNRRDERWEAQYSVRCRSDGKTIRRSLYGKSRQEVQEKLEEVLVSIHQDEYIEPSRITVGKWLYQRLRMYCLSLKKNSTCTGYEDEIKLHIPMSATSSLRGSAQNALIAISCDRSSASWMFYTASAQIRIWASDILSWFSLQSVCPLVCASLKAFTHIDTRIRKGWEF